MKILTPKDYTLEEIEQWAGSELEVRSRDGLTLEHVGILYYCYIPCIEIGLGGFLKGVSGNGNTIGEAVVSYCLAISNQILVKHARQGERGELRVGRVSYLKK